MAVVDRKKAVHRYEVWLIALDPTVGSEMQKTRPCVVISPDEMNEHIRTVLIAPLTSSGKRYPTRVPLTFQGRNGDIAVDQIRTVDKSRLLKQVGDIDAPVRQQLHRVLDAMFSP